MNGADALTGEQREIASAIRAALTRAGLEFSEATEGGGDREPVITIRPALPSTLQLSVTFSVGVDTLQVDANGADLRVGIQSAGDDPQAWVSLCGRTAESLLSGDLRIRLRRKFSGRVTGAIWVPGLPGTWNGELLAYLGVGQEHVYPWTRGSAT